MKNIITLLLIWAMLLAPGYLSAQTGSVGIGTTTPTEKLHVVGNIKADTVKPNAIKLTANAGNGKILTSDAVGNASWKESVSAGSSNIGYGVWGDCATNGNISEYLPITDSIGLGNELFGYSVSVSGNFAIVGIINKKVGNIPQGAAHIFRYDGTGWVFMQEIFDANGAVGDYFGNSVFISGGYAIVGAMGDDVGSNSGQGAAIIFKFDGTNWIQVQKITDASGAADDQFGYSVSISGNYAIVGARNDDVGFFANQGAAIIYHYNGTNWVQLQKILDATGSANDQFGTAVSISGNYAIVGNPGDDIGPITDQGSSIIYQFNGSTWVMMQKITDVVGGNTQDFFGMSVSIDGNYAIVGVPYADVFTFSNKGAACVFYYNGTTWTQMQKITDALGDANDEFGISVCIAGNYAIVGAHYDDIGSGGNQGSASIFIRVGSGWQRLQYVVDPGGATADNFGTAAAIDNTSKRFLIGARNFNTSKGKVVFGKIN